MSRSLLLAVLVLAAAACSHKHGHHVGGKYYADWSDQHRVICALGADRTHHFDLAMLEASLDYAADDNVVLVSNGHAPTINIDEYAEPFAYARAHDIPMLTFAQLAADRHPRGGWAFSIDDDEIDTWYTWRDRLRTWGVHVTFFVSHLDTFTPAQLTELHALAADGHDIEPHSLHHVDAKGFVATHSVADYLAQEVDPDIALFKAAGFSTVAYAYPFGNHTPELDRAMLAKFQLVRTTSADNCY